MNVLKILEVINDATLGGGQVHVYQLLQHLSRGTFLVHVACSPKGTFLEKFRDSSQRLHSIQMAKRFQLVSVMRLVRIIRKNHMDIVHTHGGIAGLWGRLAAILARPKGVVHTYHGIHFLQYSNPFVKKICIWLDRLLNRFTDQIICVSESDRRNGLNHALFPAAKCRVIRNGIDPKDMDSSSRSLSKKDFGLDRGGFLICHIARFDPIKGQKDLLLAFRHVVKTIPDARLLMVGDGQMRRDLQSLVQELKLREYVFFLGFRQDIQSLLSISDCFVLSSFSEGLPLSVLEAMAAGVPVVATRVGGLDEIIEDGTDGLLVPSGNPDRLAEAILSIHRDPKHAKKMGKHARKKISVCFSADTMVEAVEDVYISIGEPV